MARVGLLLLWVIFQTQGSVVRAQDRDMAEAFEIKKKYMKERFEDFYTRLNVLDRLEVERRRGEEEVRRDRLQKNRAYERARQEFVQQRQKAVPLDPTAWERELKARQIAHEKARQEYVQRRNELNRLMSGVWQIPEDEEVGIDLHIEEVQDE